MPVSFCEHPLSVYPCFTSSSRDQSELVSTNSCAVQKSVRQLVVRTNAPSQTVAVPDRVPSKTSPAQTEADRVQFTAMWSERLK